jgi:hypothetical protein
MRGNKNPLAGKGVETPVRLLVKHAAILPRHSPNEAMKCYEKTLKKRLQTLPQTFSTTNHNRIVMSRLCPANTGHVSIISWQEGYADYKSNTTAKQVFMIIQLLCYAAFNNKQTHKDAHVRQTAPSIRG